MIWRFDYRYWGFSLYLGLSRLLGGRGVRECYFGGLKLVFRKYVLLVYMDYILLIFGNEVRYFVVMRDVF